MMIHIVVAPGLKIQTIQVSVSDTYRVPGLNNILFSWTKTYIFVESEHFVRINLEWCICWLSNVSFKFNAQLVIYH